MRDLAIVGIYGLSLFWAVKSKSPFTAVMVYFWISFMNPHRYSWGFAYNLPLAMGAVAVTFLTIALKFEDIKFPSVRETYMFLGFWAFFTLTTIFAMYPENAWAEWNINNKIFFMTFVAMLIINTKDRVIRFLFGVILFIGFVGIKGAIFGLLTGGKYRVWGPPDSFIEDNNSVGLCMVMLLPLALFLKDLFQKKWQRLMLLGIAGALMVSAVLTYSRGALVGLVIVSAYYLTFSRYKFRVAILAVILVVVAMKVLPEEWFARMHTINEYEEDRSAKMRLNSWAMSFNLAKHRPLGGGFECFTLENYDKYSPDPELGRAKSGSGGVVGSTAHSIYFEVLATQGFGGLALFLGMMVSMLLSLRKLDRIGRSVPGGAWITPVSRGLTGSILGYMASGAFLSLAFFDLFWGIYGAAICLKFITYSGQWMESEPEPHDTDEDGTMENDDADSEKENQFQALPDLE